MIAQVANASVQAAFAPPSHAPKIERPAVPQPWPLWGSFLGQRLVGSRRLTHTATTAACSFAVLAARSACGNRWPVARLTGTRAVAFPVRHQLMSLGQLIAATGMKMRREHRVPLCDLALKIIDAALPCRSLIAWRAIPRPP
jgi:hypothetical protein